MSSNDESTADRISEAHVHVEVPEQPPVFNPESARALLSLFRAVLEKRRQQEEGNP
ncbi:hypothetical protein [Catelliglobosispora koreensis]|uniref:hypothetical protein n=1 Tax=Catelliglobosispora koreensis TaxID=129052 RepID=UPI00037E7C04|nr:hypothetical protein [Catelliglobosispora koreensis]